MLLIHTMVLVLIHNKVLLLLIHNMVLLQLLLIHNTVLLLQLIHKMVLLLLLLIHNMVLLLRVRVNLGVMAKEGYFRLTRSPELKEGCPRGVRVKATDCGIVVSEFVLQSRYYVHFRVNTLWERYDPSYPPSYELNSSTTVLQGEYLWH